MAHVDFFPADPPSPFRARRSQREGDFSRHKLFPPFPLASESCHVKWPFIPQGFEPPWPLHSSRFDQGLAQENVADDAFFVLEEKVTFRYLEGAPNLHGC